MSERTRTAGRDQRTDSREEVQSVGSRQASSFDLFGHEAAYHEVDLVAWYPRETHTRGQAHTRFWRETNDATWHVEWTRIRVVARHVRLHPERHPDEGKYVQCEPDEPGATPVWRCETIAGRTMVSA